MKKLRFLLTVALGLCAALLLTPGAAAWSCAITKVVQKASGAGVDCTSISTCLPSPGTILSGDFCIDIQDGATYPEQVTVQNIDANGFQIIIGALSVANPPTVAPLANSTAAFQILNSNVSLLNLVIQPSNAIAYGVAASSDHVTIANVTVRDDPGGNIYTAGVALGSWSSLADSTISVRGAVGLLLDGSMTVVSDNMISNSTPSFADDSLSALYLDAASSNTIIRNTFHNFQGPGVYLSPGSDYNQISLSTFITGEYYGSGMVWCFNSLALDTDASFNTISQSYMGGCGTDISGSFNTISRSTLTIEFYNQHSGDGSYGYLLADYGSSHYSFRNSFVYGLILDGASSSTISQCYSDHGVLLVADTADTINLSTITIGVSGYSALWLYNSNSDNLFNSYVQSAQTVEVSGSIATAIGGSVLVDPYALSGSTGSALWLAPGNSGLTLSSTTLVGGAQGAGVYIDRGNSGAILISTNTILPGAQYGIYIAAQNAGTQVYVASNTVMPMISPAQDTYGLYLNGLTSGATVADNAFVYRNPGTAASHTAYALYLQSSAGLKIDHNRIDNPGMITDGSFTGAYFNGTTGTSFQFNDVHSTGTGLANAYLLQLANSSFATTVRDNIFSSAMSVSGSSATVAVDAASQPGFASDYNDWFSGNAFNTGVWGAAAYSLAQGGGWSAAAGGDSRSLSADPLWRDPSAGVEDFHPLSKVGRYDPTARTFVPDRVDSPTIDAGDPAEDYAREPTPNGRRVNQGSYGDTVQASQSSRRAPLLTTAPAPNSPYANTTFVASATLTDAVSGGVAGGTITFRYLGVSSSAVTDASGNASVSYSAGASSGSWTCTAAFGGDPTYTAVSASSAVFVQPRPTVLSAATAPTAYVNSIFNATATLQDGLSAAPLGTAAVVFTYGAQSSTQTTDGSGLSTTTFDAGPAPGAYGVTAQFNANATYAASSFSATGTLTLPPSQMYALSTNAAPVYAMRGASNVTMLALALWLTIYTGAPSDTEQLGEIMVARCGRGSDPDVTRVALYDGNAMIIATAAFSGGSADLVFPAQTISVSTKTLLLAYDISPTATLGHTVGACISSPAGFSLAPSYGVGAAGFPLQSAETQIALTPNGTPSSALSSVSAYPNPFDARSGQARIAFTLTQSSGVRVRIFSVFGSQVKELSAAGSPGLNTLVWDGTDASGRKVSMGAYLAFIEAAGEKATLKIAVIH